MTPAASLAGVAATPTGALRVAMLRNVASRNRKSGRPARGPAKGLSGNPQRRAQQLRSRDAPASLPQPPQGPGPEATAVAPTGPWWEESVSAVISRARATPWPARLLDIETLAGQLASDEFYRRLNAPGPGSGMNPLGWLRALTEAALDAMATDLADGGGDWQRLWALCCGLTDEAGVQELASEAVELARRGITPVPGFPVGWYQPTAGAGVLVARDAYGARLLVTAAFSDPADPSAVDHWYAWDIDWCASDLVSAAGVYESGDDALSEWRAVVGPAAAQSGFDACPADLVIRLLSPALNSFQLTTVLGDEPAQFFGEFPRLFRRAAALAAALRRDLPRRRSGGLARARDAAIEEFLDRYAGHAWDTAGTREAAEAALELILAEWGPDAPPDEPVFYACSPHRIETLGALVRDNYEPDGVDAAMLLLPDWVQWCAGKTGVGGELADRALAAARGEAATPAGERRITRGREGPFRRAE